MAYTKDQLHPKQLTPETNYRFFEIELSYALKCLTKFTLNETTAAAVLINALVPFPYDKKEDLAHLFTSLRFQSPETPELVQYLRYKNLGVHKIRKIAQISPNNLYKGKQHDIVPSYVPLFPYWNEISYTLITWNNIKHNLNLFHEDLIHMIELNYIPAQQPTLTAEIKQPAAVTSSKSNRIIEYFNVTPEEAEKMEYINETTRKDMEESAYVRLAMNTEPYLLVTHYKWEEE